MWKKPRASDSDPGFLGETVVYPAFFSRKSDPDPGGLVRSVFSQMTGSDSDPGNPTGSETLKKISNIH